MLVAVVKFALRDRVLKKIGFKVLNVAADSTAPFASRSRVFCPSDHLPGFRHGECRQEIGHLTKNTRLSPERAFQAALCGMQREAVAYRILVLGSSRVQ